MKKKSWKYAQHAKMPRRCERCNKKLKKSEAIICYKCYLELIAGSMKEVVP